MDISKLNKMILLAEQLDKQNRFAEADFVTNQVLTRFAANWITDLPDGWSNMTNAVSNWANAGGGLGNVFKGNANPQALLQTMIQKAQEIQGRVQQYRINPQYTAYISQVLQMVVQGLQNYKPQQQQQFQIPQQQAPNTQQQVVNQQTKPQQAQQTQNAQQQFQIPQQQGLSSMKLSGVQNVRNAQQQQQANAGSEAPRLVGDVNDLKGVIAYLADETIFPGGTVLYNACIKNLDAVIGVLNQTTTVQNAVSQNIQQSPDFWYNKNKTDQKKFSAKVQYWVNQQRQTTQNPVVDWQSHLLQSGVPQAVIQSILPLIR